MPRRLTRPEKQAKTREALLESAATLFARQGYEATSIDKIAERAGVTRGAVYSNFSSKEELLIAVTYLATRAFADAEGLGDLSKPFEARVRTYVHNLVVDDWKRVQQAVLLFAEVELLAARHAKLRAFVAPMRRSEEALQGDALEALARLENLKLPLPGPATYTVLIAATQGLLRRRIIDPEAVSEQVFGDVLLLLAGLPPKRPK